MVNLRRTTEIQGRQFYKLQNTIQVVIQDTGQADLQDTEQAELQDTRHSYKILQIRVVVVKITSMKLSTDLL